MLAANILGIFFWVVLFFLFAIIMWGTDSKDYDKANKRLKLIGWTIAGLILLFLVIANLAQSIPTARDVYENKTELIYHVRGNDTISYDIVYKTKE